jgi:beta-lactamase regulating signal transducer with metallopeptidase domain
MILSCSIPLVHVLAPSAAERFVMEVVGPASLEGSDSTIAAGVSLGKLITPDAVAHSLARWIGVVWICLSAAVWLIFGLGLYAVRSERRLGSTAVIAGCDVVITSTLGPAVVGLARPTILLPGWIRQMSAREIEMIVAHEMQHVQARDGWLIAGASCLLIVFPWNVALWWQFRRLRLAIELDCDQRVLRTDFEPKEYGQVLVDATARETHGTASVAALVEPRSSLEVRIRAMLRPRAAYDKLATVALAVASFAVCTTAVALDPPIARPWTLYPSAVSMGAMPRLHSPEDDLREQWQSLTRVIAYFEPGALNADRSRTCLIFIAANSQGRVLGHYFESRPVWQTIPKEELQTMFSEFLGRPTTSAPMFLQVSVSAARSGTNPAIVLLGVDPNATTIDETAPAIDMAAIRGDRSWSEARLIEKTQNQRYMIELADPAAIDIGLDQGTELWIALTTEGEFIRGGRRTTIADQIESRRFVEKALHGASITEVVRGTAVRDVKGNRIAVTWYWLERQSQPRT